MLHYRVSGLLGLVVATFLAGMAGIDAWQGADGPAAVRRAKRPKFEETDQSGIYFKNLFEDALVGPRPESDAVPNSVASVQTAKTELETAADGWSQFISRETIEDEVKLIHRQLQSKITTPSRFNTEIGAVRQQFSMLSMLFGIAHEFDQDIRWKKFSGSAQVAFAEAVTRTTTASIPTFENAKRRAEDLGELIRGGAISTLSDIPEHLNWPTVVDRSPMMIRLEEALGQSLKPGSANASGFDKRKEELRQQTQLISAISSALVQEGMDDADDDGYIAHARAMTTAAADVLTGINDGDFERVSTAINAIEQSCTDCHGDWR